MAEEFCEVCSNESGYNDYRVYHTGRCPHKRYCSVCDSVIKPGEGIIYSMFSGSSICPDCLAMIKDLRNDDIKGWRRVRLSGYLQQIAFNSANEFSIEFTFKTDGEIKDPQEALDILQCLARRTGPSKIELIENPS